MGDLIWGVYRNIGVQGLGLYLYSFVSESVSISIWCLGFSA